MNKHIAYLIASYQTRYNYLQASLQRDLSQHTLEEMADLTERITMHRKINRSPYESSKTII